jgi:NAD(P)-dependent dehydrogenase (short-subunit alcohol dehydrogenase family)
MGLATAGRFLRDGACVVVADVNRAAGQAFAETATNSGFAGRALFHPTDVANEREIDALLAVTLETFGRLDCFFANAAIVGDDVSICDLPVAEWDRIQAINLRSVFLSIKGAGNALKKQGVGGSIISTSSVAGVAGGATHSPAYAAAKAGILGLTRFAAVEFAPFGIRVNTVLPGAVLSGMSLRDGRDHVATESRLRSLVPWPEGGHPEHIADVVAFLASGDARFITGESIVVDGGLMAAGLRVRSRLAEMESAMA